MVSMSLKVETFQISDREFDLLRNLIKELTGISLSDQKKSLVISRLSKRLRALDLTSFTGYYGYLTEGLEGRQEIDHLINRITTNKTDFYREQHHFEFLEEVLLPQIYEHGAENGKRKLRVWSAGCSSGEEPYTIAITLKEFFKDKPSWDVKILATDLDTEILEKAKKGVYSQQVVAPIPPEYLRAYFKKGVGANDGLFMVKDILKELIVFRKFNLVTEEISPKQPFDIIFCRNVIIYFDAETKMKVINSLSNALGNKGYLFLGHSESLMGNEGSVKLIGNSTYCKVG